ncbi:FAD-dependent monooxygenase [Actinoplanes sichuanensis]|uniref:FAD-dependent monooxygenase n=1 Tax=Actinoplanes sichuanensis TaxID=512349 RepID=A0ABW4AMJ3_9ACTN|nr:FAD-dependent monooxygenase [Actinoplanes sichuanensis]
MPDPRIAVLVVGAGLTGCVLALELAHHGIPSMVVERAARIPRQPELNLVSGRSMELLRRLGLAERIREHGTDPDSRAAVVWSRSIDEPPVLVTETPSPGELRRRYADTADGSTPVEPYTLVTGTGLTTGLRGAVREHPLIDLREGWTFTDLRAGPDRTVATVLDGGSRSRHAIETGYLVGCDGAQSTVRRCLGVPLDTATAPAYHCTIHFRTGQLGDPFAGQSTVIASGVTLSRQSGSDVWIGQLPLDQGDSAVTDPAALLHRRLGVRLDAEQILGVTQWQETLGIVGTYRRDAVYLAGQSAHPFHPPGHTVDTCLGDAVDLGWKLAATIGGWAGPGLLGSYETERRQRAVLARESLSRSLSARQRFRRLAAAGASADHLAGVLRTEPPQMDPSGTLPGSGFRTSEVVWREAGDPLPGVRPGSRLPALRTNDGRQLYDLLGPRFTLLDLTDGQDGRELADIACARGVPTVHLAVRDASVRARAGCGLLLVRPDQHVAWRGTGRPSGWDDVLDVVTGRRAQDPAIT